jgi:hypothetical protein
MNIDEIELKACPFCGSAGTIRDNSDWNYTIGSNEQFLLGCIEETCREFFLDLEHTTLADIDGMIEMWNTRIN